MAPPPALTFYYMPFSTASVTDDVLAELGTPFERVTLDYKVGDTKKPDFLKVNPNGRVPAIVHEGTPIWESAAITLYLGEVFGVEAKLYPPPGPKRGEAMKWVIWSNVSLAEAASRLHSTQLPGAKGGEEVAKKATEDLSTLVKVLNTGLEGKDFLLGEYTIVDTHLNSLMGWVVYFIKFDVSAYSNVVAWMKGCQEKKKPQEA